MKLRLCFFLFVLTLSWVESSFLINKGARSLSTPYAKRIGNCLNGKMRKMPLSKITSNQYNSDVKGELMIIPQFNLGNKDFVRQLKAGRDLPRDLLMNPEFFDEAVELGHRSLCPILLRRGQEVKILKANGDNLFVKIIQKGMPELIGMIMERGSVEATEALEAVDSETGLTPYNAAIQNQDLIALLEIVSPRKIR